MKKLSLEEVIEGIADNRRAHSVIYPLKEILFIMLTAIICGATSYVRIEMFANSRIEWLKKYPQNVHIEISTICKFRN